jgi:hypothetical protein
VRSTYRVPHVYAHAPSTPSQVELPFGCIRRATSIPGATTTAASYASASTFELWVSFQIIMGFVYNDKKTTTPTVNNPSGNDLLNPLCRNIATTAHCNSTNHPARAVILH